MTAQELNAYIDKVLGNNLRCLLPSYWWKRLLKLIVEYADSVEGKVGGSVEKVEKSVEKLSTEFSNYVKSRASFVVTARNEYDVTVIADDETIVIPAGKGMQIPALNNFRFKGGYYGVVNYVHKVNTRNAYTTLYTSMSGMFNYCSYLTSLDLSSFDTFNVTDMSGMFKECNNLVSLDLSSFDTSKVTNMSYMFYRCYNLVSLDLSSFDTSNVTDMSYMFDGYLSELDVSNFNTSRVTNMAWMFHLCHSLTGISNFDTSSVTDMSYMFTGIHLESLDVSSFDTSNVTNMAGMFNSCEYLISLDLSNFDTSNVTDMDKMFRTSYKLKSLVLGEGFFKTPHVTSINFTSIPWDRELLIQSLVTNSYDRTANGLPNMEVKLNVYTHYTWLTDEHKATLAAKGYTVVAEESDSEI